MWTTERRERSARGTAVHATTHESTPRDADERAPPPATTVHGPRSRSGVGGERGRGVFLRRRGPGLRGGAAIHDHAIVHMQRVCSAGSAPCGGWCALWAGAWLERGGEFERSAARVYALYPRVTRTPAGLRYFRFTYTVSQFKTEPAQPYVRALCVRRASRVSRACTNHYARRVYPATLSHESQTLCLSESLSLALQLHSSSALNSSDLQFNNQTRSKSITNAAPVCHARARAHTQMAMDRRARASQSKAAKEEMPRRGPLLPPPAVRLLLPMCAPHNAAAFARRRHEWCCPAAAVASSDLTPRAAAGVARIGVGVGGAPWPRRAPGVASPPRAPEGGWRALL